MSATQTAYSTSTQPRFGRRIFNRTMERLLPKALIDKINVMDQSTAYVVLICILVPLIGCINFVSSSAIPFNFLEFWTMDSYTTDTLLSAWPMFAWGTGVTALISFTTRNQRSHNNRAEQFLTKGFAISLMAGFFEEVVYRWLLFFVAIPLVYILSALTLGLYEWFFVTVLGPVADFFTLGKLHHILFNGYGWAVGSAVIVSNTWFRDGHKYQGLLGFTNSWFIGMFLFLVMFDHGLPMAITMHFLYDMFIYCIRYIDAVIERALGWD